MNNLRFFAVICLAALFGLPARGESLVQFPTGPAAWTVTIVQRPGMPPPPAALGGFFPLKQVDIAKVNGVSRVVTTFATGRKVERWGFDQFHFQIITDTTAGGIAYLSGDDLAMGSQNAVVFDASSFEWLRNDLLKDTVSMYGKTCYHYVGTVTVHRKKTVRGGIKVIEIPLDCEAWIDKDTLLPVAFDDSIRFGVFTFHDPPSGPLKPPPPIQSEINSYMDAVNNPPK